MNILNFKTMYKAVMLSFLSILLYNCSEDDNEQVSTKSYNLDSTEKSSETAGPQVVFEENFDDQPDWSQFERCLYDNYSFDCNTIIEGWDYLYTEDKNSTHAPFYIEAIAGRGGIGKGYHFWDESRGTDRRWKTEAQLAKKLPQAYQELWFSFWIKFNPGARWEGGSEASKVFRGGAYNPLVLDGTAGTSVFNTNNSSKRNKGLGRTTGGMFFVDVVRNDRGRTRIKLFSRCNPSYKCDTYDDAWDYFVNPGAPSTPSDWKDNFGDGNWHKIEVHFVMDSAPEARDGVLEVFYDGNRLGGRNNIPWRTEGSDSWIEGINFFAIAGNSENVWAGDIDTTNSPEQSFYFIDDVKVCTTRCL